MNHKLTFAASLLLISLASLSAQAQHKNATLLLPGGSPTEELPQGVQATVRAKIKSLLRSEGYRIRDLQEKPLSDASLQACKSAACIEPLAKATGAELIVGVALWQQKEKQMLQVAVSLEEPGRGHHSSSTEANEEQGALEAATEKAFRKTLATLSLGQERTLIIGGGPKGALVKLDGTDVGVLPYQGQIKPGTYTLTVTLKDHLPYTNQIHITSDAPQHHIKVKLEKEWSSDRPVVGPLIVGGAGALVLTGGIIGLLAEDCQAKNASGSCIGGERPNRILMGSAVAVGAGAIIGALLWYLLGADDTKPNETRKQTQAFNLNLGPTQAGLQWNQAF
ncbi:MAG: PEGA domain-containing protein [Myxococcales bacterium]|nr:MAG: PEGA domain-containing protein [Myxococcales bacterium]